MKALSDLMGFGPEGVHTHLVKWQADRVRIQAPDGMQINLDGEPLCSTDIEFKILPGVLHYHLPAACPLLQRG